MSSLRLVATTQQIRRWTTCTTGGAKPDCIAFRRPTYAACFRYFLQLHFGSLPEDSKNFDDDRRDVV